MCYNLFSALKEVSLVKVAFSSDNHLDLNKINVERIMNVQALYLLNASINLYVIAGDLFNDFEKTLTYVRDMQTLLADKVQIRFIAGNHDMAKGVTYEELESDIDPLYLHNKFIDLTPTVRLIGNNGWYDYDFVGDTYTDAQIQQFKQTFWYDRRIQQPVTDKERFNRNMAQIQAQLDAADRRQTVVVSHFVPRSDYIKRFPASKQRLDMANALLGSSKLGKILDNSYTVATVTGHLHLHPAPLKVGNNTYYNAAVGYHTVRVNEWDSDDFMTEWQRRLVVLDF